ncbi:MAG: recombinase family protein [Methylocapsa sp.]|nr:recombinase family protein [Methylocapsa sp.]
MARSTRDRLNTLAAVADKGAGFRSLGDTWADTMTAHWRLMLSVLGGLAEFERELIRARTSEGRERAKAKGVGLGRKPTLTEHQKCEAIRRGDHGEDACGNWPFLQRERLDDFTAHTFRRTPERAVMSIKLGRNEPGIVWALWNAPVRIRRVIVRFRLFAGSATSAQRAFRCR